METYATTLSKYNTAEAALEKNQPKFSQVPYTDAQATMINRCLLYTSPSPRD